MSRGFSELLGDNDDDKKFFMKYQSFCKIFCLLRKVEFSNDDEFEISKEKGLIVLKLYTCFSALFYPFCDCLINDVLFPTYQQMYLLFCVSYCIYF